MTQCTSCQQEIDRDEVMEELGYIFDQVDQFGVESLTERQQMVYAGKWCYTCYEEKG